jgi:hypothetical protein
VLQCANDRVIFSTPSAWVALSLLGNAPPEVH